MRKKIRQYKYIVFFSLLISFLISNPLEFANEEREFFRTYSIKKPIIRIGLGVNLEEIKINASSGMKIYEIRNGLNKLSDNIDEVLIKGKKEKLNERFLIQFPPFREKEEAKKFSQRLREKIEEEEIDVDVYIDQDLEMNTYKVWIGYFDLKSEAEAFARELYNLGFRDAWIFKEEITEGESKPFWLFCDGEFIKLSPDSTLYIIPSNSRSYLSFNGKPYRGIFIVKSTVKGIVLINVLNIEDYLKGVVPVELSPYTFNEIEAQKAQAVAARTYALKNLGMFKELGFDLCDTQKCQVYKGMSVEDPLSTRAIEETEGEVMVYRGKLINALYTSTCGGSTENVENVFLGKPIPYLRGTPCFYEHQREWWIKGYYLMAPVYINGFNISPEIARLMNWGIIPLNVNHSFYRRIPSNTEVCKWIENVLSFLNRKFNPVIPKEKYINYANLAHLIIDSFGWQEKLKFLLKEKEIEYFTKDLTEVKKEDKKYIAYLILEGIFPIAHEIKNPYRPLLRSEILHVLYKLIMYVDKDRIHKGTFKLLNKKNKIVVEENKKEKEYTLSPRLFLIHNNNGFLSFANYASLIGGEEIYWIEKNNTISYLEIHYSSFSNMLERSSIFNRWQVRKSREELEKKIRRFYPIGKLIDLIPKKRGISGRVIELLIIGSENQVLVKGFRIRTVLGLKETLFVIDREYDEDGNITHFIFTGRGWGHGVGLCQVGAYGMAREGANYKKILKKYYKGIKIVKMY